MPITKQAKKALRQSQTRYETNLKIRQDLKTLMKKVRQAIDSKAEKAKIQEMMRLVQKGLDKAVQKNVIKKNTAGRKLSRLMKFQFKGNKPAAATVPAEAKVEDQK